MPVPSFSSWQHLDGGYGNDPQAPNVHYGPGPFSRDSLDARRMMAGNNTPDSQYPDGYLGTIVSRRDDRLLNAVKDRQNKRPMQRGAHKGERVDPRDYFWDPAAITADDGIRRGMRSQFDPEAGVYLQQRMAPTGEETVLLANRDKLPPRREVPVANAVHQLAHLKPNWS